MPMVVSWFELLTLYCHANGLSHWIILSYLTHRTNPDHYIVSNHGSSLITFTNCKSLVADMRIIVPTHYSALLTWALFICLLLVNLDMWSLGKLLIREAFCLWVFKRLDYDHIQKCSGATPSSMFWGHSWQCLEDWMAYLGSMGINSLTNALTPVLFLIIWFFVYFDLRPYPVPRAFFFHLESSKLLFFFKIFSFSLFSFWMFCCIYISNRV